MQGPPQSRLWPLRTVNTTKQVKTDSWHSQRANLARPLRPVLLPQIAGGRIGSARAITFGWAQTSKRRFGR